MKSDESIEELSFEEVMAIYVEMFGKEPHLTGAFWYEPLLDRLIEAVNTGVEINDPEPPPGVVF